MALRNLILLCCAIAVSADQCKYLQNYLFYNISGEAKVNGVAPANARRCIMRAMTVMENTIAGLRFLDVNENPEEEAKLSFDFQRLALEEKGMTPSPSETVVNCTISRSCPTFAVQFAKIYINSDLNFVCKQYPEGNMVGVDLFQTVLFELLTAFGMRPNDDNASILYNRRDNFGYQDNGQLSDTDRERVGQLYLLRAPKN